mmetsp:Transcript_2951/g.9981  ORF Transcript_2951/g.9981 Transcript_2951/m.9981 type:complete len:300 (+) Transcript_2951:968-1867(+)
MRTAPSRVSRCATAQSSPPTSTCQLCRWTSSSACCPKPGPPCPSSGRRTSSRASLSSTSTCGSTGSSTASTTSASPARRCSPSTPTCPPRARSTTMRSARCWSLCLLRAPSWPAATPTGSGSRTKTLSTPPWANSRASSLPRSQTTRDGPPPESRAPPARPACASSQWSRRPGPCTPPSPAATSTGRRSRRPSTASRWPATGPPRSSSAPWRAPSSPASWPRRWLPTAQLAGRPRASRRSGPRLRTRCGRPRRQPVSRGRAPSLLAAAPCSPRRACRCCARTTLRNSTRGSRTKHRPPS